MKYMKQQGYHVDTLLSNGQVRCRMYNGFREALNGFAKNVTDFFGGSAILLVLYTIITGAGAFIVYFFTTPVVFISFVVAAILHRVIVSLLSRQSLLYNILFIPFQLFSFTLIAIKALIIRFSGKFVWKNRTIIIES